MRGTTVQATIVPLLALAALSISVSTPRPAVSQTSSICRSTQTTCNNNCNTNRNAQSIADIVNGLNGRRSPTTFNLNACLARCTAKYEECSDNAKEVADRNREEQERRRQAAADAAQRQAEATAAAQAKVVAQNAQSVRNSQAARTAPSIVAACATESGDRNLEVRVWLTEQLCKIGSGDAHKCATSGPVISWDDGRSSFSLNRMTGQFARSYLDYTEDYKKPRVVNQAYVCTKSDAKAYKL